MACSGVSKLRVLVILLAIVAAHNASAAAFQPTLDKAGNAVGGTVSSRHWHNQKLASRIQGWQNCLQKYMSDPKGRTGQPPDPCVLDTGAGTALPLLSGRGLLQDSNEIPNYAATATTTPTGAASSTSPASLAPATLGTSSTSPSTASGNQNPYASTSPSASTSPAAVGTSSASTSSKQVARGGTTAGAISGNARFSNVDLHTMAAAAVPVPLKPQPIGPDPTKWQQTKDFPEGTRLTHDQAVLLLSGKGFHGR